MRFKVGDMAVYPAHGVGKITSIEAQELEGVRTTFFILKILDGGMTIMVPIRNADAIGMREPIPAEHVDKVYAILRDRETPTDKQTWNRRYREYMSKIKTGDPMEVAKVLRDLALMKRTKNLSFGERKMFDQAHGLLVQEIAVAKGSDEQTVAAEIEEIFVPKEGEVVKKKRKKKR